MTDRIDAVEAANKFDEKNDCRQEFLWNILDILTIMRTIKYLGTMCNVKIYIMELYKLVKIKVPIFDTFFTILIKPKKPILISKISATVALPLRVMGNLGHGACLQRN